MAERKEVTYLEPAPHEQGTYAAVAMASAVIISWGLKAMGIDVPGEVTAAVATIIGWAAGKWGT